MRVHALIEPGALCSEHTLTELEARIGRPLPAEFRQFAQTFGSAFVGGTIDGDEELEVLCFLELSEFGDRSALLFEDYFDGGGLPFASCSLGGIYSLNREDRVWYALNYAGKFHAREVASTFGNFVERIEVRE